MHIATCQRVYSANLSTTMNRKFTDQYLVKKVKPFEWIQETQAAPSFISRSCCYNCPHWTQAASFLGYHLPTESIVSCESALRSRNSWVVRLFWSALQNRQYEKTVLTLPALLALQHISARVCPLTDSYAPSFLLYCPSSFCTHHKSQM